MDYRSKLKIPLKCKEYRTLILKTMCYGQSGSVLSPCLQTIWRWPTKHFTTGTKGKRLLCWTYKLYDHVLHVFRWIKIFWSLPLLKTCHVFLVRVAGTDLSSLVLLWQKPQKSKKKVALETAPKADGQKKAPRPRRRRRIRKPAENALTPNALNKSPKHGRQKKTQKHQPQKTGKPSPKPKKKARKMTKWAPRWRLCTRASPQLPPHRHLITWKSSLNQSDVVHSYGDAHLPFVFKNGPVCFVILLLL